MVERHVARATAIVGLMGIALIHLLDLQSKFHETPYLGAAYLALIAGCFVVAVRLVHHDDRSTWYAAAFLAALTMVGYAVNRTVGMPNATEDVGNWLEPLGLASLFVEAMVVAIAVLRLRSPDEDTSQTTYYRSSAEAQPTRAWR
ncbi:MAG TPA: hypothetical protein VFJ61_04605 [Solirubrobacterales bacterium]|nr:hypothetical protein [Solirubrobacterales bacterium]